MPQNHSANPPISAAQRSNSVLSAPTDTIKVITTHTNADYDALASMLAAQKLHPEALVVFPGSQDRNLRGFFIESMVYLLNIVDLNQIDLDRIDSLILVDTRQPSRIGPFAELVERNKPRVIIYDHHPDMPGDISGDQEVVATTGATITLLAEIIQARDIALTSDEATIMCLGLYEDTGSFSFASTTARDFKAAAFLLSKGADLRTVTDLTTREITPEQVALLNEMIQAADIYNIKGVDVMVTSVDCERYVPDFAFLVHKLMAMESINALFALALMENKIHVIARSRMEQVDAGTILAELDGGGHPWAASATVRGQTLVQVQQHLMQLLSAHVQPRQRARNLMSTPAITVDISTPCRQAAQMLNRYSINALLVTETVGGQPRLAGFISRQIIEKALYHKLGDLAVREYMNSELASVGPEADLDEIQTKIIGNKQRILPVIDTGRIVGAITRTDLLNTLVASSEEHHQRTLDNLNERKHARMRNIVNIMRERLPQKIVDLLEKIGRTANEMGFEAYVVGGFVRDLFLRRPNEDIDIVIEGNGIAFAVHFARLSEARVHTHAKFNTAVITFDDGFRIDVASARLEYYTYPAALPVVEMSSIKLDMFRRDFTINTLAIRLSGTRFGTLIDFFSAQKDIKERAIRVLHNLSFVEDPTRVFRAIRFEQRFDFTIGKVTEGLIENAVRMNFFKRLSGRRLFTELRQMLEEKNPALSIQRLKDFDLLKVLHPKLRFQAPERELFHTTQNVLAWFELLFLEEHHHRWAPYLLALSAVLKYDDALALCQRLELAPRHERLFTTDRFKAERTLGWLEANLPLPNSQFYRNLEGYRTELVLYLMAATDNEAVKRGISAYFTSLRYVQIDINGDDLKAMGLEPGPVFTKILVAVRYAKLDNKVGTRDEQLVFVHQYIAENKGVISPPATT
jgi:tRNA nucleotidyltransferase (CCA-adding enzyme)